MVGRGRLRELLADRLGVSPPAVELTQSEFGTPELAQGDLHFSMARSGEMAAYALARGSTIGIDIEAIRAMPESGSIAARAFSECERNEYFALDPEERVVGFFNWWTRKEAFLKALGCGLSLPLNCFDVSLAPARPAALLRIENAPGGDTGWRLDGFDAGRGYAAAVASSPRRLQ